MSKTLTMNFSTQILEIDSEINSLNANPTTTKLLTKAKEILLSFTGNPNIEFFSRALSQLNTILTHLESTGYTGSSVPSIISEVQGYILHSENSINLDVSHKASKSPTDQKIPQQSTPDTNPIPNITTKEIGEIINQTIRNSIDEIIARVDQKISTKFSLITREQYDSYSNLIHESLNATSSDIVNQLSTLAQVVQDNNQDSSQVNSAPPNAGQNPTSPPPAAPASKVTTDTAKIMVEVGKVLQKSSKEISEQSSFMNNISHEISGSISKFKKAFNFKSFLSTVLFAWLFAGIGCYFISSYIINNITKIQQYEQEHEAIQNLKVIKHNLDADGLKCWDKIFSK